MPSILVADCPRCGSGRMTFDVYSFAGPVEIRSSWVRVFELFSVCRNCKKSAVFVADQRHYEERTQIDSKGPLFDGSLNSHFEVRRYVSLRDIAAKPVPEHLPDPILIAFREATSSEAGNCWNAAGAMFRLCLDMATREKLPPAEEPKGPNPRQRRDLGLRLPWLFDAGLLPADLRDLAHCVREDGNDGAHAANLTEADAADLYDFTYALLDRLYTQPARLTAAQERRNDRRKPSS